MKYKKKTKQTNKQKTKELQNYLKSLDAKGLSSRFHLNGNTIDFLIDFKFKEISRAMNVLLESVTG